MPSTIWDVLDWNTVDGLAKEDSPMGRFAYKVIGSTDPDGEFERGCRAYVWGAPYPARRFRVFALSEYFRADRLKLARWLRAKGIIGPKG